MRSTMSSVLDLSDKQCAEVANYFFIHNGDPTKISHAMRLKKPLDRSDLQHWRIRQYIVEEGKKTLLTREKHMEQLALIRDEAMGDPKTLRVALAAEIARGQAAGLYNFAVKDEAEVQKIEDQSTDRIRKQLEKSGIDLKAIPIAEFTPVEDKAPRPDYSDDLDDSLPF